MKHHSVTFSPEGHSISIHDGATLVEAAGQAGIVINTTCGGGGTCQKCEVFILPERQKVLACQYRVESDLIVEVPARSRFFEQQILRHGIDRQVAIAPPIRQHLPELKEADHVYGVAVDIGTTTIVANLVDMATGRSLANAAAGNPQIPYGDDVVSRIAYAESPIGLDTLQAAVVRCLNELIEQLTVQAKVPARCIFEVTVAGNTTMTHILLKFPLRQLGQAPYTAHSTKAQDRSAGQLGIAINPRGNVHVIQSIAGFVGADTVAAAVAVGMHEVDVMTLLVDIGTNGEIVLGTKDNMYAASCAAGPALEGARISQGGRAVKGAIESVVVCPDGTDIDVDVIGACPARTICGSGLIDAVAVMLELGLLDATGRFLPVEQLRGNVAPAVLNRVVQHHGQPAFVLAGAGDDDHDAVLITQKDIRETQLAKAAIRSGIRLLQKKMRISDSDIRQVLLAGAFGNFIRRESAIRIGLLPRIDPDRVHFVGNAAGSGARMVLLSSECRRLSGELADRIRYVEIAHELDFQTVFADELMFEQ